MKLTVYCGHWFQFLAARSVAIIAADKIDGCQILQTTDPRTPCYILIKQAPAGVPPFVYMFNLPRVTPQTPCPVSQTLDASFTCYVSPYTADDPAFILNIPLPPGADDIDESPAGKAKLRAAKTNPLFQKAGTSLDFGQGRMVGSQPSISSFDLTRSTRLPQPIGLTQPIGQTRPIGPPSPQLTMAVFKPLVPALPQIQPPAPQNQFIYRTVPTLFQAQHIQSTRNIPRKQPFQNIIRYSQSLDQNHPEYYTSFTQSTQKGSFPYPSSEGSGSISAFQGPYPPSYEIIQF